MSLKILLSASAAGLIAGFTAGCAFDGGPEPAPSAAPAPPAPAQTSQAQAGAPVGAAPGVAAPGFEGGSPPPPPSEPEDPNTVVVRGQTERQVTSPDADPRSVSERMADIRAWDRCVTRAQSAGSEDPSRVQLDTPEDICRRSLGMSSRGAVPESRRR